MLIVEVPAAPTPAPRPGPEYASLEQLQTTYAGMYAFCVTTPPPPSLRYAPTP